MIIILDERPPIHINYKRRVLISGLVPATQQIEAADHLFKATGDSCSHEFFFRTELANETYFFAVCVSSDETVYNGGFSGFCMDIGGAYGVDFDVFLISRREERFVGVGSCSTRIFERRIKF